MNNAPYFVTGFPRSRTAWIANFLTYGPSYCHHDALRLGTTAEFLSDVFEKTWAEHVAVEHVGDSDSALLAIVPQLVDQFPTARWVLIERPAEEVIRSYTAAFGVKPYPQTPVLDIHQTRAMVEALQKWIDRLKNIVPAGRLLVLPFSDLDLEGRALALWEWCVPGASFSYERYEMLNTFSVNIITDKIRVMDHATEAWAKAL